MAYDPQQPLDRINAASRLLASPAPGNTTQGGVNLGIANAMSRSDIGNRFGFGSPQYTGRPVQSQSPLSDIGRKEEMINRGIDPDKPALYINPQRQQELLFKLKSQPTQTQTNLLASASIDRKHLKLYGAQIADDYDPFATDQEY